jgi:hypothetical protein
MSWRRALLIFIAVAVQACSRISPSPTGTASAVPVGSAFLDHIDWTRLGAKDLPGLPALKLVAAGGSGLVGVGDRGFWRSDDGSAWQRVAGDEPTDAGWRRLISASDGAVLAVGSDLAAAPLPLISRISVEGIENLDVQGPGNYMSDVTAFAGHLVAVGGDEAGNGLVWTSQGGAVWTRVQLASVPLLSVVAGGGSRLVAGVDVSAPELGNGRLDLWQSGDGLHWESATTFSDAGASDIVALPAGFVAVGDALAPGETHTLIPAAWSSRDGAKWVPMTTQGVDGALDAVTEWHGVPIAVGWTYSQPQKGIVWASRDGVTWEALAGVPLEASRLTDVSVMNDRLVIVGIEGGPTTDPVVLIGMPPG